MNDENTLMDTPTSSQETSSDGPTAVPSSTVTAVGVGVFKKRAKTLSAQRGLRKPITTIPSTISTNTMSDEDSEEEDYDEEQNPRTSAAPVGRKRKRGGSIQAASTRPQASKETVAVTYDVNRSHENVLDPKNQATATSSEFDEDQLLSRTKSSSSQEHDHDNLYRGQKNYRQLIPKREQVTTKYNPMGPQKAASNIRMTTVVDYAPDVCKDYKLTGYCGFGDNCKFLHDRGDYKAGWQIDRDWEIEQQKKNEALYAPDGDSDSDDDMDNVPFLCLICREDYEDPVVTKCGHFFCMTCAIKRYKKTPNCLVCGAGTMGIFNRAKEFEKKLEAKRKRKEEKERRKRGLEADEVEIEDEVGLMSD